MTASRTIRALIFDFDGLIVDTELPALQSWQEIYAEHGHELPLDRWALILGGSDGEFDPLTHLEERIGRSLDRDALEQRRQARKAVLAETEEALPGVLEYIEEAGRLGLKLAVTSSSHHAWVDRYLDQLGIRDRFDVVVCAGDAERVKPFPDLYLLTIEKLGIAPGEGIVFEDSPNGITAAQAAGLFCIAVPNEITRQLPVGHADLRIESMADMPLKELLTRVKELLSTRA